MNKKHITNTYTNLKAMKDKDINYSDIPETTEDFWKDAKVIMPEKKKIISIRLDADILNYFKQQGKGYQSKINAVLRSYVDHQEIV